MNPDQHAAKAEELLDTSECPAYKVTERLLAAQVHATLSLRRAPFRFSSPHVEIGPVGPPPIPTPSVAERMGSAIKAAQREAQARVNATLAAADAATSTSFAKLLRSLGHPGYNGIWGVGDSVSLTSPRGHRMRVERMLGGDWAVTDKSGRRQTPTAWTDAEVTAVVIDGTPPTWSDATKGPWAVRSVRAQRRPWRGSGEWVFGDVIYLRNERGVWEHRLNNQNRWFRPSGFAMDTLSMKQMERAIAGKHTRFQVHEFALVGVSHNPNDVRALGG